MVSEKKDFITDEENSILFNLLEKRIEPYEIVGGDFYIWKEISKKDKCFQNLFFLRIFNRNLLFARNQFGQNLNINYMGFAVQKRGFDYHADSVWPEEEEHRSLGLPGSHGEGYKNYNGKWIPNYVPNRKYTTVLYLNEDIIGGETHFPTLEIFVKPQKNKIIGFGCDENYIHGVMPTTEGVRKAFICWFE